MARKKKPVSKTDAFKTGYTKPALVKAAKRNSPGNGQKKKRDKLDWDDQGTRFFQGGAPGSGKRS